MKARLLQAKRVESGGANILLRVDRMPDERLAGKELRLELTEWRERRSLSANAYFHTLARKIAEAAGESLTEAKNQLVSDYGTPETLESGRIMTVTILDSIDWRRVESMHLHPTQAVKTLDDRRVYRAYIMMRPTHTYDTKEMARLIDGTIREAQELGIETIPPAELERMVANWKAS